MHVLAPAVARVMDDNRLTTRGARQGGYKYACSEDSVDHNIFAQRQIVFGQFF